MGICAREDRVLKEYLEGLLLVLYAVYAIEKKVVHFIMPVVGCTLDCSKGSEGGVG